ncbi:uncharacterized protein K452DRAFT_118408 [Aplosporella prunicola CBS 121167]|uniref:Short chain dehydrogenase n=1 Tax=Aplosporella prunicola CBS 121167 TaxID=1176127 RepID=A0A6A6BMH7_9PEZI|nr:uncharacterized protein K452DRAFT_118408 [Aplosporella prunicola CBS 121167]KAF2145322.1 hypothetical protein K452DRAFT_118408 [Aplosporella prunicola CBS 121167]
MAEARPVALVIGASRGIGRQIAIDLAKAGYVVIAAAKSTSDPAALSVFPPDPNSASSTISTVAAEITQQGNACIAMAVDVRSTESIIALFADVAARFHRLDALVYNAGAIWWAPVAKTSIKRFKLLQSVNIDGLYSSLQAALPLFERAGWRCRVVVVCPPIYSRFFRGKAAYAVGKVGMSVLVKGLAMDWERDGKNEMAISGIWPAVAIESAATQRFTSKDANERAELRTAAVFSDAVVAVLEAEPAVTNGQLFTDEDFLREHRGVADFDRYNVVPGSKPRRIMPKKFPVLTVEEQDDEGKRVDSTAMDQKRLSKL